MFASCSEGSVLAFEHVPSLLSYVCDLRLVERKVVRLKVFCVTLLCVLCIVAES